MNLQLDPLLETLLSSDNQRRTEAENFINSLPDTNFEEGIDALLASMNNPNNDVTLLLFRLLKWLLSSSRRSTWTFPTTSKESAKKRCYR